MGRVLKHLLLDSLIHYLLVCDAPLHHTRAYESHLHLDVATGSGLNVLIIASMIKNPSTSGHLLVTSDISPLMQEAFIRRFEEAGFMMNPNNSVYTCADEILKPLSFSDEEKGIHVKTYIANNEKLPFLSEQFESYTASLSLMYVENRHNQLREAYRVLRKEGIAGFSVWGRRKNFAFVTLAQRAIVMAGVRFPKTATDPFYLGVDK